MEYPYTKVSINQYQQFYKTLLNFGYMPYFLMLDFKKEIEDFRRNAINLEYPDIYIIIDDVGIFGRFCFYLKGRFITEGRKFVTDPYKFLKQAAKLKDCTEF